MATEQYANNAQSTLSSTIIAGDSTLSVASAAAFPTVGNFQIIVDSEIMTVTAVSGTTFTITRGAEGTTAAGHTSGAAVTHVLTRSGLLNVGQNLLLSDSYAALPNSSIVRQFLPNNGYSLYRDNGSAWSPWGPVLPFTAPVDSQFSWVNQGSATVTTSNGGVFLRSPQDAAGNIRMRVKSIPSAPYKVTMGFIPMLHPTNFYNAGMILRNSSTGNLITFQLAFNTSFSSISPVIVSNKYTDPTTFSASYTLVPPTPVTAAYQTGPCMWFQIQDNSTNRIFNISVDGQNFFQLFSVGRTDFTTPDQIGFYVGALSSGGPDVGINVLSWNEA